MFAEDAYSFYLLAVLTVGTAVLVVFTLRKVFMRWRAANSAAVLDESLV